MRRESVRAALELGRRSFAENRGRLYSSNTYKNERIKIAGGSFTRTTHNSETPIEWTCVCETMSSSDAYYGASAASPAAGGTAKPSFTAPSAAMPQQIPTFSSIPGSSLAHSDHSKIFVGGLSWQTNEESLRWHFEQYGPVISVEVMRDRNTGGA